MEEALASQYRHLNKRRSEFCERFCGAVISVAFMEPSGFEDSGQIKNYRGRKEYLYAQE
jgi:hypothetical protein